MGTMKNIGRGLLLSVAAVTGLIPALALRSDAQANERPQQTEVRVEKALGDNSGFNLGTLIRRGTPEDELLTLGLDYEDRNLNYSTTNGSSRAVDIDRELGIVRLSAEFYRNFGVHPNGGFSTLTLGYRLINVDSDSVLTYGNRTSFGESGNRTAQTFLARPGVKFPFDGDWLYGELNLMRIEGGGVDVGDFADYELGRDLETDSWVYGASVNSNDEWIFGINRVSRDNREDGTSLALTLLKVLPDFTGKLVVAYTDNINKQGSQLELVALSDTPEKQLLVRFTDDREVTLERWDKITGLSLVGERERYAGVENDSIRIGYRRTF